MEQRRSLKATLDLVPSPPDTRQPVPDSGGRIQLTPAEVNLLEALDRAGDRTMRADEWAEEAGVSEKVMRSGRKELIRRGFVELVTGQKDGGASLTRAGLEKLHKLKKNA